ncbi:MULTISPECIES: hypothetical protein [Methanobacterium]|jgi:hypothetical protein|uniref:Uncharacterized protein n=1 Tax=Methanobacterium veterum TaxID=408577 RepID=A0A9E5A0A4_9EURY|nr:MULTISPECIES: hypothetical protein [Methanobacterium]MCZ3364541.1 hypothetical protein [Methanobacterium veterum]MCZ3372295.1 hypothetical protein [Methanobacterium veterum]
MGKEKAIKILRKHFKALYDYAGMEWTSDDDKELEQLVDELGEIIEEKSGFPESKNIL